MDNTNLAYDLRVEEFGAKKPKKVRQVKPYKKDFMPIVWFACVCLAIIFMISKNIEVAETENTIKNIRNEIAQTNRYVQEKTRELDEAISLGAVEEYASTKLNMQRPEPYQIEIVSIDLDDKVSKGDKGRDDGEKTAGADKKKVKKGILAKK